MFIIIVGCGEVGYNLARMLCYEHHDIVLIEEKSERLQKAQDHLDVKIIQGSGGIRKIRWGGSGRGKRGGIRIIYYWATNYNQIFMLYAFAKNERDDLTKDQLSMLKKAVVSEFEDEK